MSARLAVSISCDAPGHPPEYPRTLVVYVGSLCVEAAGNLTPVVPDGTAGFRVLEDGSHFCSYCARLRFPNGK